MILILEKNPEWKEFINVVKDLEDNIDARDIMKLYAIRYIEAIKDNYSNQTKLDEENIIKNLEISENKKHEAQMALNIARILKAYI